MKRVLCVWLPNWPQQGGGSARREPDGFADRQALLRLVPWCEQFSPTVGLEESPAPESLLLDATGLGPLFGGEIGLLKCVWQEFRRHGLKIRAALADTVGAAWAVAHFGDPGGPHIERLCGEAMLVAAGQSPAALAPLTVRALRLSGPTLQLLQELGLNQIGQLPPFSRDSLAARFPAELLARLDQAAGRLAEPIVVQQPPSQARAEWTFEQPADRMESIQHALAHLLARVAGELAEQRRGVQQLQCTLRCASGKLDVPIGLFRPTAAARHLAELAAMQLEQVKLREAVTAIRVAVTASAPLECRQQELFETCPRRHDPRPLALLVDRLSSRLGREAVVRARLLPEAQPEYAWRYEPLIGGPSRAGSKTGRHGMAKALSGIAGRAAAAAPAGPRQRKGRKARPPAPFVPWRGRLSRPLRLVPRPEPLDVISVVPDGPPLAFRWSGREHRIRRSWGPERIQAGWWRGRSIHRDYYRVETDNGQWFWLFRQVAAGQWFLHGTFD
ncbi:MAG: DNA polymerase Y family protein [Pirellulales bacterium]